MSRVTRGSSIRSAFAIWIAATAACTAGQEGLQSRASTEPAGSGATQTSVVSGSTIGPERVLNVDGASFDAEEVFVRHCDSQLFGGSDLELVADAVDRVGPLILLGLRDTKGYDPDELAPLPNGELLILKYPTQLSTDEPVWLAVAPEDRAMASLIYDSSTWVETQDGRLPFAAGDSVVAFEPCDNSDGFTQYNGGILVSGANCIKLHVWLTDPSTEPVEVAVPFGAGTSCSS